MLFKYRMFAAYLVYSSAYTTAILDLSCLMVAGWAVNHMLKTADTRIAAWRMAPKNRR